MANLYCFRRAFDKEVTAPFEEGNVHVGANSMVFTDATASASGADVMKSTVGKVQIGASATDTTTIQGSLTVEDPTTYYHAAHKGYVDALRTDMQKYDDQSVALSAALASLPTMGGDGTHTCGVGTGHRGQATALAMGCAANLASLSLPETVPGFLRDASINVGTSFLTSDDRDFTLKAGLSWQFGGPKSTKRASSEYEAIDNRVAQIDQQYKEQKHNATIRNLKAELDTQNANTRILKAELDTQNAQINKQNATIETMRTQMSQITALLSRTKLAMVNPM